MESPTQISDCEDGEIASSAEERESFDETTKESAYTEEQDDEDNGPLIKKPRLDIDSPVVAVDNVSNPSSAGEGDNDDEATATAEHDSEEDGEEGEILSDTDDEDEDSKMTAIPTAHIIPNNSISSSGATSAHNSTSSTAGKRSLDGSTFSRKHSSHANGSRDGHSTVSSAADHCGSTGDYQNRRQQRYRGASHTSANTASSPLSSRSGIIHSSRKPLKRSSGNTYDRKPVNSGAEQRSKREGSPFKRKPKMKAPPPPNSPFWGERRHMLPTPNLATRTGYNLDVDYPQLPRKLVREYFPEQPIRFARDSSIRGNAFNPEHKSALDVAAAAKALKYSRQLEEELARSPSPTEAYLEDQEAEESTAASLPSMQDLVKGQLLVRRRADGEESMDSGLGDGSGALLADVFRDNFPLLDGSVKPVQNASSLKGLVGSEVDIIVAVGEHKENLNSKVIRQVHKPLSAKKQMKAAVWHSKQRTSRDQDKPQQLCKYYQQGFCKSGDSCAFIHVGPPMKKKEVCRYYLGDNCTKGDECPYLHDTFPCKFFHSRNYCIHGDNCRFSHASLTGQTRELLAMALQQEAKGQQVSQPMVTQATTPGEMIPPTLPPQQQLPMPLMSVDTSAPLMVGVAGMQQQGAPPLHLPPPPRMMLGQPPPNIPPPQAWEGQPGAMGMIPAHFGEAMVPPQMAPPSMDSAVAGGGGAGMGKPPEQKLGILPTPPPFMKLIGSGGPPSLAPIALGGGAAGAQDPRSCDPRMMSAMTAQQPATGLSAPYPAKQEEEDTLQIGGKDGAKEEDVAEAMDEPIYDSESGLDDAIGGLPQFQPLEPPKEMVKHKPFFIPDLPALSSSAGLSSITIDTLYSASTTNAVGSHHHAMQHSPPRSRSTKTKYSHLKVKSRSSKTASQTDDLPPKQVKRDSTKSILKRTTDKPVETINQFSNKSFGNETRHMFSSKTDVATNKQLFQKQEDSLPKAKDAKTAAKDSSNIPYYAMFDTGLGNDLQIDSAFGSLED